MSGAGTSRTVRTVRSPQMNLSVSSCVRTSACLWLSRRLLAALVPQVGSCEFEDLLAASGSMVRVT